MGVSERDKEISRAKEMIEKSEHQLIVIYDGECDFCGKCISWLQRKLVIQAIPFQTADLPKFGLSHERCSKEVVVVDKERVLGGSSAVIYLLRARKNLFLARLLRLSGPLAEIGYRWVANHRDSALIRLATRLLRQGRTSQL